SCDHPLFTCFSVYSVLTLPTPFCSSPSASMTPLRPAIATRFPYTTLFRSDHRGELVDGDQILYVLAEARHADGGLRGGVVGTVRSEEHTSELQSRFDLVCRLLLEKKKR